LAKYSEKTRLNDTLSTTKITIFDVGSNPGRRNEKPTNNHLSCITVCLEEILDTKVFRGFAK
jgi:hypothetical protein